MPETRVLSGFKKLRHIPKIGKTITHDKINFTLTFEEYLKKKEDWAIDNLACRLLSGVGEWPIDKKNNEILHWHSEGHPEFTFSMYKKALNNLKDFEFIGYFEGYEQEIIRLFNHLEIDTKNIKFEHANKSEENFEISEEVLNMIRIRDKWDQRLYYDSH